MFKLTPESEIYLPYIVIFLFEEFYHFDPRFESGQNIVSSIIIYENGSKYF